jgi:AcrR family transcriptional regulator
VAGPKDSPRAPRADAPTDARTPPRAPRADPRTVPRPILRADARANRDAVLRASARLFAERGLDVSFDELARAAGVGRATIYRHFPTREDLLAGILERSVFELEEIAAALPPGPGAFMTLLETAVRQLADNLPLVDLLPQRSAQPPSLRALGRRFGRLFEEPLRAAQEAGVVDAELIPDDVRTLLSMLTAVVRPGTPKAEQRRAWQLALRAIGASGGR